MIAAVDVLVLAGRRVVTEAEAALIPNGTLSARLSTNVPQRHRALRRGAACWDLVAPERCLIRALRSRLSGKPNAGRCGQPRL